MDSGKKKSKDERRDRKSATGMSGDPKKGGRGGKFTWEGAHGYAHDLHISNHSTSKAAKARDDDGEEEE